MKKYLFVCLFISIFSSCVKEKKEKSINAEALMNVSLDLEMEKLQSVDAYIDTMFMVPLETTDNALLGSNVEIHIYDSLIYAHSLRSPSIFIYDMEGKLKRTFERKGEGPEEYLDIEDFFLKDDKIYIYCRGLRCLKQYDLNGKYLKELDLSTYPHCSSVIPFQNQYICYFENPHDNLPSVYVVNETGELINSYFKDTGYATGCVFSDRPLAEVKEGVVANFVLDYNTYLYNGTEWIVNEQFDFGDNGIPIDRRQVLMDELNQEKIMAVENKVTRIDNIVNIKDWTHYKFWQGSTDISVFINSKTGKHLSKGKGLFNHCRSMMWSNEDYFVGVIYSGYLTELLANRINLFNETISSYEQQYLDLNIGEEDNPVLCFFKLKN